MEEGKLILSNDKSPLKVIRTLVEKVYWYYIPDEKVYITSSGDIIPGIPPQDGESGEVVDDIAVGFRMLIKCNELKQFVSSSFPKKLFIK